MTALHLDDAGAMHMAQVGSCRAYRLRAGELELLCKDHTLATLEPAQCGKGAPHDCHGSVVTRLLGMQEKTEIDIWHGDVRAGDIYLICSDGLWAKVGDTAMVELLNYSADCVAVAHALVSAAQKREHPDDATGAVVRVS